jgi:glutamate 5-kinase
MVIADGSTARLKEILDGGEVGTLFMPSNGGQQGRKRWLANTRRKGAVVVDLGAVRALTVGGKSLLPPGISNVSGTFDSGDLVAVESEDGTEIARGLVRYPSDALRKILGRRTQEVADILGDEGEVVIHRDDLVVIVP